MGARVDDETVDGKRSQNDSVDEVEFTLRLLERRLGTLNRNYMVVYEQAETFGAAVDQLTETEVHLEAALVECNTQLETARLQMGTFRTQLEDCTTEVSQAKDALYRSQKALQKAGEATRDLEAEHWAQKGRLETTDRENERLSRELEKLEVAQENRKTMHNLQIQRLKTTAKRRAEQRMRRVTWRLWGLIAVLACTIGVILLAVPPNEIVNRLNELTSTLFPMLEALIQRFS